MTTAKQQHETEYTVTLKVAGSKVKAMADAAKKIGVEVSRVEKTPIPAPGEWATEWVEVPEYMNPVLVNTDGRVIQRFEEYDDNDQRIEGKYAYYYTRDAYGKQIANADGKYHIETLEEAKTLVRKLMTEADIQKAADWVGY